MCQGNLKNFGYFIDLGDELWAAVMPGYKRVYFVITGRDVKASQPA
jgi:hypothetical protein